MSRRIFTSILCRAATLSATDAETAGPKGETASGPRNRSTREPGASSGPAGAILPLKAIYRRAVARGIVVISPATALEMPANRSRRDRIGSSEHAAVLLAALPEDDRGLRALRWEDVELLDGVISVRRGWDDIEGEIAPKTRQGAT